MRARTIAVALLCVGAVAVCSPADFEALLYDATSPIPFGQAVGWSCAAGQTPDAAHSDVPRHMVTCPAGDATYDLIVRTDSGLPWARAPVVLQPCSCTGYRLA